MNYETLQRIEQRFVQFERETGIAVYYNQLQGKPKFRADVKKRGNTTKVFNKKGKLVVQASTPLEAYDLLRAKLNTYLSKADVKAIWKDSRSARGLQYT